MNIQEFAALQPGDKIRSMFDAVGTITEATEAGVRVRWGEVSPVTFFISVRSTAWMHWSSDDDASEIQS